MTASVEEHFYIVNHLFVFSDVKILLGLSPKFGWNEILMNDGKRIDKSVFNVVRVDEFARFLAPDLV